MTASGIGGTVSLTGPVQQADVSCFIYSQCFEGEIHLTYFQCLLKDEMNLDLEMLWSFL